MKNEYFLVAPTENLFYLKIGEVYLAKKRSKLDSREAYKVLDKQGNIWSFFTSRFIIVANCKNDRLVKVLYDIS